MSLAGKHVVEFYTMIHIMVELMMISYRQSLVDAQFLESTKEELEMAHEHVDTLDFSGRCVDIGARHHVIKEILNREKQAGIEPDPDIDAFMKGGYLMSRKLEGLAQQVVAMGFSSEHDTMAFILIEGKVEKSVAWLFEGGEDADNQREPNNLGGGGNLKIDISEELAQITEMEMKFKSSLISPYRKDRDACREMLTDDNFIEATLLFCVFMNMPLEVCERRDPKSFYKLARAGKIIDRCYNGVSRVKWRTVVENFSNNSATYVPKPVAKELAQRGISLQSLPEKSTIEDMTDREDLGPQTAIPVSSSVESKSVDQANEACFIH
ncbi:UBA-like protein [Artemisia annua]|uniref:UBA-like protein n=1 Tax=Artemisia annua TaxID=35608 RepID=A0A2U1KCZ7_ARTAN|nr:UBA-like protein [Artemisia annua]